MRASIYHRTLEVQVSIGEVNVSGARFIVTSHQAELTEDVSWEPCLTLGNLT